MHNPSWCGSPCTFARLSLYVVYRFFLFLSVFFLFPFLGFHGLLEVKTSLKQDNGLLAIAVRCNTMQLNRVVPMFFVRSLLLSLLSCQCQELFQIQIQTTIGCQEQF